MGHSRVNVIIIPVSHSAASVVLTAASTDKCVGYQIVLPCSTKFGCGVGSVEAKTNL